MCPAKDTFQKEVSLNGYPRLRAIVEELSDSMTGNAMTDFMYLFFSIVLFLTLFLISTSYVPSARYLYTTNTATEIGIANGIEGIAVGIVLHENEPPIG